MYWAARDKSGKALLLGSHSDTQPTGGWLDGALGVIYALEVVRALAADNATRALPVDAVSFQDEESRFVGCLGSRSLIGALSAEMEQGAADSHGVSLEDALREAGLAHVPRAAVSRANAMPDSSRRTSNRVRIWKMPGSESASSLASSACAVFASSFAASRIMQAQR